MDTKGKLAEWLYEHYGKIHHDSDYNQIPWAEIGYMVKNEYLKKADKLLDAFAFKDMYEALKEAQLQIEYLHDKFKATGTGNAVLTRIQIALNKAEGK